MCHKTDDNVFVNYKRIWDEQIFSLKSPNFEFKFLYSDDNISEEYQIQGNTISYQNKKTISGLSQKLIKDSLIEYINIKKLNINCDELIDFILNKRTISYKYGINININISKLDS